MQRGGWGGPPEATSPSTAPAISGSRSCGGGGGGGPWAPVTCQPAGHSSNYSLASHRLPHQLSAESGASKEAVQGLGVPALLPPPRTPPLYEEAVGERTLVGRGRLQAAVQAPAFSSHNNHS